MTDKEKIELLEEFQESVRMEQVRSQNYSEADYIRQRSFNQNLPSFANDLLNSNEHLKLLQDQCNKTNSLKARILKDW